MPMPAKTGHAASVAMLRVLVHGRQGTLAAESRRSPHKTAKPQRPRIPQAEA